MCTYKRFIFECKHVVWTGRVKQCTIGEDYQQRDIVHDCMIKEGHPLHSRRLLQDCERCVRLKKASDAFWVNIQECRDECTQVILSHPTNEGGKVDTKPMDEEDMEYGGEHDAESHQHSTPDSTTKVDQDSRETDNQDGWVYSLNGRLQTCGRDVERDIESLSLPDTENIEPQTLAEKDGSAVISFRVSEQFKSYIPQQQKTDSRLPEALPNMRNLGIPSDTKIQINQKSNTASDKDRETVRITSTLPTLRAIPKPKSMKVDVDNHHPGPTSRQSIPIARKPSVGKVMRLPQPTRAMSVGLNVPDRSLI
ncbi:unnamed protein product [Clonostachys solani]|uniref:Uncharacterized protein n=1 Tax=Clonostachys solani TaxID=160281 RepID=A0A9N9Z6I7_9HYPO|nr:unnamed protein product [Clonostachys solani]